jgi:hypothetical protein
MATKKSKRASNKVTARKLVSRKKLGNGGRRPGELSENGRKELGLVSTERAGDSIVDAARRLWLSVQSLVTSPGKSRRKGRVSR